MLKTTFAKTLLHSCLYFSFLFSVNCVAAEKGLASYYSNKFNGHSTSSGERYNKDKLTAAHRTLPLGSKAEVTNLKNGRSVTVTINDRGPHTRSKKRIMDLSYAAAKQIGLIQAGIAPVEVKVR